MLKINRYKYSLLTIVVSLRIITRKVFKMETWIEMKVFAIISLETPISYS